MKVYTLYFEATQRCVTNRGSKKPGDTDIVKRNYQFQETERGWRSGDGELFER